MFTNEKNGPSIPPHIIHDLVLVTVDHIARVFSMKGTTDLLFLNSVGLPTSPKVERPTVIAVKVATLITRHSGWSIPISRGASVSRLNFKASLVASLLLEGACRPSTGSSTQAEKRGNEAKKRGHSPKARGGGGEMFSSSGAERNTRTSWGGGGGGLIDRKAGTPGSIPTPFIVSFFSTIKSGVTIFCSKTKKGLLTRAQ